MTITVTISGPQGSGKSTAADYVSRALTNAGYIVNRKQEGIGRRVTIEEVQADDRWGPEIPVDGKRPEWLLDDELDRVFVYTTSGDFQPAYNDDGSLKYWNWPPICAIRLPSDHWAYTAIEKGFTPWPGGPEAPPDWDGGMVLFRDGTVGVGQDCSWAHVFGSADIIGYRKREETVADIIAEIGPTFITPEAVAASAIPVSDENTLTPRDQFAMAALPAVFQTVMQSSRHSDRPIATTVANMAYQIADAMLAERQ